METVTLVENPGPANPVHDSEGEFGHLDITSPLTDRMTR
jgi:hypothetical protein